MEEFKKHVDQGLSAKQKKLSSMYFYDDEGSRIFQEIMAMPEYYLTDAELENFQNYAERIIESLGFHSGFNLIELGAGDGEKTAELIKALLAKNIEFTYTPIDISEEANRLLATKMRAEFPSLKLAPKTGDYFEILAAISDNPRPSLVLFLGSNIGNYVDQTRISLLQLLEKNMKVNDALLIGVDLKKNPNKIRAAYFDPHGITKRFNLNLLRRINRELDANFDLTKFDFYCYYNPLDGELRSFIISLCKQEVHVKAMNKSFSFKDGECIWTELSKKYDLEELEEVMKAAGFHLVEHFIHQEHFFTDSLFRK